MSPRNNEGEWPKWNSCWWTQQRRRKEGVEGMEKEEEEEEKDEEEEEEGGSEHANLKSNPNKLIPVLRSHKFLYLYI